MKKDLSDVCSYLKGIVIPHTPDDFTVAEKFRHGLSDEEIRKGIAAFREFLYVLYDRLAADKAQIDVKTGAKYDPASGMDSIHKCFPAISELAAILFSIGLKGKLETQPRRELVLSGSDLLCAFDAKSEKYYSLKKMSGKRKVELFGILSDLGFYFEDADFSEEANLEKMGVFYVQYENDDYLPIGLKLIAEAQANIKSDYYKLQAAFIRGDFYPLAGDKPKAQVVYLSEFIGSQPIDIKEWIAELNKFLVESGCKVKGEINNFAVCGNFTYTLKRTVCSIEIRECGCYVRPQAYHLGNEESILPELPDEMLDLMKGGRSCGVCAERDPNFVHCRHGGPFKYTIDGVYYERCRFDGFSFPIGDKAERQLLQKWIEMELGCEKSER